MLMSGLAALGCATSPQAGEDAGVTYTAEERRKLGMCLDLSNFALGMGGLKLRGASADELKGIRARELPGGPSQIPPAVLDEVIDQVYAVDRDTPYEYALHYFGVCSEQAAGVAPARAAPASRCMRVAFVARAAQHHREKGTPKETVYEQLANVDESSIREIVDRVYAETKDADATQDDTWNACLEPYSG
jgi:hypothetical protein